ncbi:hypothetical protein ACQKWADRAFT_324324 [Trichoderma austrokoningii]
MESPNKQRTSLPTPRLVPEKGISTASLENLPPELIEQIMGYLPNKHALRNFAASSPYFAAVLKANKIPILKRIIRDIIHVSNMGICMLTMGILQTTRQQHGVWACLYALSRQPTLDAIHDAGSLANMLDLAIYIQSLVKIYAYARYPSTFWRHALQKYAERWPDGYIPHDSVSICPFTTERLHEVAQRLCDIRDAALDKRSDTEPRWKHEEESLVLFQREMFSAELKLRCDRISELGQPIPPWVFAEAPCDGVQSFLELIWCCSVHNIAKHWNRNDGLVWTAMNRSSWSLGRALGIRFYVNLAMHMPIRAGPDEVHKMCAVMQNFFTYYLLPDDYKDKYQWFLEFRSCAWEGLWEHGMEYLRLMDEGGVGELGTGTDYF